MAGNLFGKIFQICTYGESHGKGIGVVIDGCPAGLEIKTGLIEKDLQRRKPGQSHISTPRKENESFVIQSGVFEGKSTGAPINIFIPNTNQRSQDYDELKEVFRPSHADYTYLSKYGHRDFKGGGRSSARETAARVAAGAIAKMLIKTQGVNITAFVKQIGKISIPEGETYRMDEEENIVRCPHSATAKKMITRIEEVKESGDSLGGIIHCVINNCPVGLGEPVFDRLNANLAKAMMSINAVKGFELGSGFAGSESLGSAHNDEFYMDGDQIKTKTNRSGGIQGGISNGMPICFNVAFKPTSTIYKKQHTLNKQNEAITLEAKGRHDPCVVPRAVPIVEAMAALVIADSLLRNRSSRLDY